MNPVQSVIDQALQYVRQQDPHWEDAQPSEFKRRVVAHWKQYHLRSELSGTQVLWTLTVGDRVFTELTGIFVPYKLCYNPYGKHRCTCVP